MIDEVEQWNTYEIVLKSKVEFSDLSDNYTSVDVWATFRNGDGVSMKRPAFWAGNNIWKVRFAPPDQGSVWSWKIDSNLDARSGLNDYEGSFKSIPYEGSNSLISHGLLKMSKGKRSVVHADDHPFLVIGDTPWALPFRATVDQAKVYAADRQRKGFNTALLMSVQPDMEADGPNARNTSEAFARAFDDLSDGHLNKIQPAYFDYLDSLINVLLDHEIVPVFQPVFHGYGWKGKKVLGNHVDPLEYERYCKYLLARYGSQPAMWLLAGDNGGRDPGVKEGGEMMEAWDCYQQPTGLHYNPCDDYIADWAIDNPIKHCEHYNKTYQDEEWLDFQWAQSGHGGEHMLHKVKLMYDNKPTKASANGEPTYEGMAGGKNGLGWWQGEEAWMQLLSGGTMGVVYGAATLWQWKVTPDELGWPAWTDQNTSWKEALQMEGSNYVGHVAKAFAKCNFTDMEKRPDLTGDKYPLLAKEGKFYISYLNEGGQIQIQNLPKGLKYKWFNPKTGKFVQEGETDETRLFNAPDTNPWVLIITS